MEVAHVWDESARFSQASAGPALGGAAMAVPRIVETVTSEFKPVENAHEALDDWVLRHTPTQVRVDLAAFEAEHVVRFREHYGRAVDQLYVEFDALVALVDQVNFVDKAAWPPHRALQFVTIAKNLKAFHSSIERLSKGSYQDAITLTRSAYDAFLRVVHISIYCDSPSGALVSKPNKGVPSFNATGLVQDVLRLDWLKYNIMSPFAHGNTMEVLQSLRDIERRNDIPQRFGLSYDDDTRLVETVLPFLQFLLLLYLRFVREFLIGSADAPDRGQLGKADEAIRWAAYLLATLPKPYWKRTVDDIDYLFQILALADAGDDWRIVRDQRAPIAPRNPRGPDGNP